MPGLGLSLAIFGRAGLVGITDQPFDAYSCTELLGKEAEVVGCADHLLHELDLPVQFARRGSLDLSDVVTDTVGLDADAVNDVLDRPERFGGRVRTVIVPTGSRR